MRQLDSPLHWGAFNCVQLGSALVAYNLPNLAWVLASSILHAVLAALYPAATEAILSGEVDA
eukprot:6107946-Heterocapsa_arctica.AAC.1